MPAAPAVLNRIGSLAFYAVAYGATAALQKGLGFIIFLWLARSLPVGEYAKFGLMLALQTGVAALAIAGIIESVIGALRGRNTLAERVKVYAAANTTCALLSGGAMAIAALCYPALHQFGVHWPMLVVVMLGGVLSSFFVLQAALARLEEMHAASLALSSAGVLAGFVCGAIGFIVSHSVAAFFIGFTAGLVVALLLFVVSDTGVYRFTFDLAETRSIMSALGSFILVAVVVWLSGYGSTYLVKFLFTSADVAKFTFAYTLSSILLLVANSLNQVWNPRFLRLVHTVPIADVERSTKHFTILLGFAIGLVGAGTLAVLPTVLQRVGGNLIAYRGMSFEMLLLFAAYAVSIPWWHVQNYYYAHSRGRELMLVCLVTTIVGLGLWLGLMQLFGVSGIYFGFLVQTALRAAGAVWVARKNWAVRVAWEGTTVAAALLAAGAVIGRATS